MGVKPCEALPITERHNESVEFSPRRQQLTDRFEQGLAALPGQRGYRHDDIVRMSQQLFPQLRRAGCVQQVPFVPRLDHGDAGRCALAFDHPQFAQHTEHLDLLLGAVRIGNIADVDDHVGGGDFFQGGPERRNQLRRQVGNEPYGVGQDRLVDAGQADPPHGRVERGEQQILSHHPRAGQAVEQR